MTSIHELNAQIEELEADLQRRDDQIKDLRRERDEARELVDQMREQVEDGGALIDSWIEVFRMEQDEDGLWIIDHGHSLDWDNVLEMNERHKKLIRQWNKFIGEYNSTIAPRSLGRPLQASDDQVKEVHKLRKAGRSLRAIAEQTSLGLGTVRTIVWKDQGTDRTTKRTNLLRKREFDRLRAADYRTRKKARDRLPGRINAILKRGEDLVKAAKGLDK